ncbi:hypothetical protein LCGC14_2985970, partial [marine sediment metagenome]
MTQFDWLIFDSMLCGLLVIAWWCRRHMRSVADFLIVGRKMLLIQKLFQRGRNMMILLWGIGAMAVMGAVAQGGVSDNEWPRYASAVFVRNISPIGLVGFCGAGLMFAYITTDNSYYLAWSAIIVNNIITPLRKTPLSLEQHLKLLRIVIVCIAVFLLTWGLLYKQQESILSYLYLTGAIFTAAGILTFVGLYWKRANPLGAYLVVGICIIIPMADLIGK